MYFRKEAMRPVSHIVPHTSSGLSWCIVGFFSVEAVEECAISTYRYTIGQESGTVSVGSTLRSIEKSGAQGEGVQQPSAHGENGTKLFRVAAKPTANLIEGEEGCRFRSPEERERKGPSCRPRKTAMNSQPVAAEQGNFPIGLQLTINADFLAQFAMRCLLIGLTWSHVP